MGRIVLQGYDRYFTTESKESKRYYFWFLCNLCGELINVPNIK